MCKIILELSLDELEEKINEAIKDGYKVSGGITRTNSNSYIVLMVK